MGTSRMWRAMLTALAIAVIAGVGSVGTQHTASAVGLATTRWVAHGGQVTPQRPATPSHLSSPATASSAPVTLPVTSFGDMVVDAANSHIFLSAPGSNEILVLDYSGNIVKTITGEAGADAMVITGSTLYVTLKTGGGIDRIDTSTLTETSPLTSASLVDPTELVLANGALWTSNGNQGSSACLAKVSTSTGAVTTYSSSPNFCYYGLGIRPNPANANMLITWDLGLEPATVITFDVSTDPPTVLQSVWESRLQNLQDIAGGPTGTGFIAASGYPYEFDEYRYTDLAQNGIAYAASNYPTAVATTSAHGGLMVGGLNAAYGNSIWAYRYDQPAAQLFSGWYGASIPPRGLAFRPDGGTVFAVGNPPGTSTVALDIIDLFAPRVSGLAPQHGPPAGGTTVTISGTSFFAGTSACAVTAVDFGSVAAAAPSACTDTSLTVTAPAASPSSVDITVTTSDSTSATSSADVYTYDPLDYSAMSTSQYHLSNSDGSTWSAMDAANLALTLSPTGSSNAVLGVNADLWTANAGYNQDIGLFVSIDGGGDTLLGWKESGGYAGTYSPNAAYLQTVEPMLGGHTYVFTVKWKTNKSALGATIYAGAGPITGNYSPTRLTAHVVSSAAFASTVTTGQYVLTGGAQASTWYEVASALETSVSPTANGDVLLGGNADMWTASAGLNQDLGIFVSVDGGAFTLVSWKESGGNAGTYSPNAAFVQGVFAVQAGHTYKFTLAGKPNKNETGSQAIAIGAGPISSTYSPMRLTVEQVPTSLVTSAVSTSQYSLSTSDGQAWTPLSTSLSVTLNPAAGSTALIGANADLWTANAGYNQDVAVLVSVDGGGATLLGWKESGGFAGTYSPNAAFLEVMYAMTGGHTYQFTMQWKTNMPAGGATIYAGAGPISSGFSPTRLTVTTTE